MVPEDGQDRMVDFVYLVERGNRQDPPMGNRQNIEGWTVAFVDSIMRRTGQVSAVS